jgi:molecular chaperone DnaK (HSP70)
MKEGENSNNLLTTYRTKISKVNTQDFLNTTYIGIDFGTSTTIVSYAVLNKEYSKIEVKPMWLEQTFKDGSTMKSELLPSVIAWYNNNLLIGHGAAELKRRLKKGVNIWYSFKMELGEDLGPKYFTSELGRHSKITILTPRDAAEVFFKYIKDEIDIYIKENNLPVKTKYAVSIPASFEANQRKDLIDALYKNGMILNKQSLIDEPNAAFISYLQNESSEDRKFVLPSGEEQKVLVFDFGAGTCDISILEVMKDYNGIYSKNLSISKFENLGGDDIDRYIATNYLFDQLLLNSGIKPEDFKTPDKKRIINQLLKIAENLKISICEKVSLQMTNQTLTPLAYSDEYVVLPINTNIMTKKGELELNNPRLSYKEFNDIMKKFLNRENTLSFKNKYLDEDVNNIFNSIYSALNKAELKNDDIDYVLLIGGSSKNPYIQAALKEYFKETILLIPNNLQTHVSIGTAIHSLLYNGFNINFIKPITSEPLIVITQDIMPRVILRAGTQIPCDKIIIDDLVTAYDGQKSIELPICLGSENKLLYNLKIVSNNFEGFKKNTPVRLEIEITEDKLLLAKAAALNQTVLVEPINPFANRELTTEKRIILEAQKKANIEAEKNGGKPTKSSLLNLVDAYLNADDYLRAAETLELVYEIYQDKDYLNDIGVYYSRAGYKEKGMEFYELAYKYDKNPTVCYNLAMQYYYKDRARAKQLLEESLSLDPNYSCSLLELGNILMEENNIKGKEYIQKAFNNWERKYKNNTLRENDYFRLAKAAENLGLNDFAEQVRNTRPVDEKNFYNKHNLTKSKSLDSLTIKE